MQGPPLSLYQNSFAPQFSSLVKTPSVRLQDVINLINNVYQSYQIYFLINNGSNNSFSINAIFSNTTNGLYVFYNTAPQPTGCYNSIFYDVLASNDNPFIPWVTNNSNDPTSTQITSLVKQYYTYVDTNKLTQYLAVNIINSLKLNNCQTIVTNSPNPNILGDFSINATYRDIGIYVLSQANIFSNFFVMIVYNILGYTLPTGISNQK